MVLYSNRKDAKTKPHRYVSLMLCVLQQCGQKPRTGFRHRCQQCGCSPRRASLSAGRGPAGQQCCGLAVLGWCGHRLFP